VTRLGGLPPSMPSVPASRAVPVMAHESPLRGDRWGRAFRGWAAADSPVLAYYVLLGAALALFVIGLVMVLSASMITSMKDDGSAYTVFLKQLLYGGVGLVGAALASRVTVAWWKRLAMPALAAAVTLQVLVFTPLGATINGSRNWIHVGSTSLQPSEFAKIGLVLTGALILTAKRKLMTSIRHVLVPYLLPVVAVTIALVIKGGDLGTTLVLLGIVAAVLFVAGVPGKFFAVGLAIAAAFATLMAVTSANRLARISGWVSGSCTNPDGPCGQAVHGSYALADGGWWGVGLGASREKWSWLPEAQNDFIFAIIGEELGLPGTLMILTLFLILGWGCYRIVLRTHDQFVRVATAGVMAWLLIQAIINIGGVIGLLPIIGVPLPLVSAGGSALVTTMLAIGMLLSFARQEPGARDLLTVRASVVGRSISVVYTRLRHRRAP